MPSAFGTYRVLHQIGSGVLGPVFRTYDPQRDRLVAVKAFRLDVVPEQVARLADALRRLATVTLDQHGIVPAIDAGLEGTTAYLATEYVAAETLDVTLRHLAPAPLDRALPILSQMADAIDAAWASGAGHGALHPRDVFVTVEAHDVRITGFGVVPALESVGIKTPVRRPYAAPERASGEPWDICADVYSLGAIAHELLTRRRPAGSGEQDGALTSGTTAEQRVQIRRVLSTVLAERPQHRFQSARAFVEALAAVARGEAVTLPSADRLELEFPLQDPAETIAGDEARLVAPVSIDAGSASANPAVEPALIHDVGSATAAAAGAEIPVPTTRLRVLDRPPVPAAAPDADLLVPSTPDSRLDTAPARMSEGSAPGTGPFAPRTPDVAADASRDALDQEFRPPVPAHFAMRPAPSAAEIPLRASHLESSSFPWGAMGAVGAAGIVVGIVIGYEFAGRHVQITPPPPAAVTAAGAETDVPVSPGESASSGPAPAEPEPAPAVRTAAPKGRMIVRSTPPGALLVIDGRPHGQTPVAVNDLALGSHTIEVARSGFVPYTDTVTLGAKNPVRTVAVRLQPGLGSGGDASRSAAAALGGSIFVDSRPQKARVLIDGRVIGTTPLRIPDLQAGSHTVRLELTGYQPFATTVGLKAGEQARVTAALEEK